MSLSRSRTITIVVSIATLTSNTLSAILFHQLPDDPYRLAANFSWYLHFANILSVFGFIGALRQHALSVTIFSNYLILDTILCSIPRFLLLSLLAPLSSTICATTSSTTSPYSLPNTSTTISPSEYEPPHFFPIARLSENWSEDGCHRILKLAQWALLAGVLAATLLQFVGALCVREYGRGLARRDDARAILEEEEEMLESEGDENLVWVIEQEGGSKC